MSSILVINAAGRETRVALVENGHIAEFYLERKKDKGVVGNIYKGRVVRVLPGMQAAFVDIGLEKAAFLYVSDVVYDPDFARAQFELTEGEHEEAPEIPDEPEAEAAPAAAAAPPVAPEHVELEVHEHPPGELPPPQQPRTITGEYEVLSASEAQAIAAESATTAPEPPPEPAAAAAVTEPAIASEPAAPPPSTETPATPPAEPLAGDLTITQPLDMAVVMEATKAVEGAPPVEATPPELSGERRAPRETPSHEQRMRDRDRDRDRARRRDEGRGRGGRDRDRDRDEDKLRPRKSQKIEDLLKPGQEVVVQISKDPIGSKGARLTSHISIPGRHLVFMPTVDHVGISRRIGNEKERRRLREIVERMRPPGTGFIVRTVAESVPQEKLESDIRFLIEVWNEVVRRNEKRGGPGLLHPDLDLILRATRDLFAHDVEKLVIDERDEYERVVQFVVAQDPALKDRVLLHENEEPIFDAYGIEHELNRAVQRKVWLKSGGYLIIDQAEALTAIDVNSGRYVGKKSLEETITKINVEAAKEIVYQLRLRNIGGIIICDFIDMEKPQNRDKVFKTLQEALGRDKAKTNVLRISELGLVEMTRKRVRESIGRVLHEDCTYCDGKGFVKTATTVSYEIFREIRREAAGFKEPTLVISCHPDVGRLLQNDERLELRHLMDRFNKTIQVRTQSGYHREQYDIYGRSAQGVDQRLHTVPAPPAFAAAQSAPGYQPPPASGPPPPGREPGRDRGDRDRGDRERGGDRDRHRGGGRRDDRGRHGGGRPDRGGSGDRDRDRDRRGGGPPGEQARQQGPRPPGNGNGGGGGSGGGAEPTPPSGPDPERQG